MKIYTYYENINFKDQDELISLWTKSWKDHGFEPIVLTRADAKKSDFYEEFVTKITELHQDISKTPLNKYGLSCWLRWLAYSTQVEEKFLVSDYDIINHNFYPIELENTLHLIDDCCPCIASGTPSQFLSLCKKFIEVTSNNKDFFSEEYQKNRFPHFHDQNFFVIHYDIQKTDKNKDIKLTRDISLVSGPQHDEFWKAPIVHYSHHGCHQFCKRNNVKFDDKQRCLIIKEHIDK